MTYRELARRLVECGCAFDRQAKGSHEIWRNPATGGRTTIPYHANAEVAPGTFSKILKDLGISRQAFQGLPR